MSLATLLESGPPTRPETFSFEHQQAHRTLLGSMSPLADFSAIPYLLTPGTNDGFWHQDHQQAHNDFTGVFPGWYGGRFRRQHPILIYAVGVINPGYNIQDVDKENLDELTWWTFQNHYNHLDAQAIQNPANWVWPFW